MPAKKRKPTPQTPESVTAAVAETPAPPATEPDVFDRVIAARTAAPAAAGVAPADEPQDETAPVVYQPDPFPLLTVPVGDGADAPTVRLFRNRRMNQVAVRFDEKPAEPHRQRMREEGYKWREAEGVWTKQLGDHKATGQIAAERLVGDIANAIRAEAGLAPAGRTPGD